jgi:hypothetical protein
LKVTVIVRLLFRTTVQDDPDMLSQPSQPPNVEVPVGEAVSVTVVPLGKLVVQVLAQPRPGGELVMVPEPVPANSTVRFWAEPPEPVVVKQTTLAVM